MDNEDIAKLIEDMSASLQGEMNRRFDEVNRKLDDVLKTQKRHSALFTADGLAVRGMERTVMDHDERLADLSERVRRLENGHAH